MSIFEHIILFSLLFIVYAFWGKYLVNKDGTDFWSVAIFPILLFVFVIGSRYGWGNDYFWYKEQFENPEFIIDQPAFKWLNQFLNVLGFNYVGAYMIYALIFIISAFVFLRSYGEPSRYMYCFLVPATFYASCWTIRQGVGFSFVFLALTCFHQQKWLPMALLVLIALNIHSATFVSFAILLGIFFLLKKPIHYWISIPLYIYGTFILDPHKISLLEGLITQHLSFDNKFQGYIDRSEAWFGEEAITTEWQQGTFALIVLSLFYISIIYLGYRALKARENKQVLYIYNTAVLGMIMLKAVWLYEILRRFPQYMEILYFIPLGYIFYVYFRDCKQPKNHDAAMLKKHFPVGITLILAYLFMYYGRFLLLNPRADFFWHHLNY